MLESQVKNALYNLVHDNKLTLVSGLSTQGNNRALNQIVTERLAMPEEYYFVSIWADLSALYEERGGNGGKTTSSEYDCLIEVVDFAIPQSGENELYGKMGGDFALLTDRMAALLVDTSIYTSDDDIKFRLSESSDPAFNRRVTKRRLDTVAGMGDGQSGPFLYAVLEFTLVNQCTDTSVLY